MTQKLLDDATIGEAADGAARSLCSSIGQPRLAFSLGKYRERR
jgi:hypothetical protein